MQGYLRKKMITSGYAVFEGQPKDFLPISCHWSLLIPVFRGYQKRLVAWNGLTLKVVISW